MIIYEQHPCILAYEKRGQPRRQPKFWGNGFFLPFAQTPLYIHSSLSNKGSGHLILST